MMEIVEGSYAVAHAVKTCRPHVISAYPITPQTHIVEDLSQFVADGELDAEFINVESEHTAMSVCLGASATGARVFSATASQGLLLMSEVLFNASGMRLPIVLCNANRSVSAPLSIWNDQQDSFSLRDCGWIQLYVEDCQEAHDAIIQAYKIAEDREILLPVMVCMDGFTLTHTYEPVDLAEQEEVDDFLPPYEPEFFLNPKDPKTFGAFAEPDKWTEFRYMQFEAMERSRKKIEEVARDFERKFGRNYGGLINEYGNDDAEIVLLTAGSIIGTILDVVEGMENVKILKIRSLRPFPVKEIRKAVRNAKVVAVLEKAISIGFEGDLLSDVKACLYNSEYRPPVIGFTLGLASRDVPKERISEIVKKAERVIERGIEKESEWIDLRREFLA
ncbi:MAG: pyruvate synthase subunit PorA [Candidatus Syntropharchaeia archaeon]